MAASASAASSEEQLLPPAPSTEDLCRLIGVVVGVPLVHGALVHDERREQPKWPFDPLFCSYNHGLGIPSGTSRDRQNPDVAKAVFQRRKNVGQALGPLDDAQCATGLQPAASGPDPIRERRVLVSRPGT